MNLHDYARMLRRGWWLLLALLALGIAAGYAIAVVTPAVFQVRATIAIAVDGDSSPASLQQGNVFAMQRASTYAHLATTDAVLERAASAAGHGLTADDLRSAVVATAREESGIIDIDVSGGDPELVPVIANEVADALADEAQAIDAPGVSSPIHLEVVAAAEVPTTAAYPQPRVTMAVGGAVGLILAIAILVLAAAFSTRIRSAAELPRRDYASISMLPVSTGRGSSGREDAVRRLRTNLEFGPGLHPLMVVAPVISKGSGTTALELAAALAEVGSRVVLVELSSSPRASVGASASTRPGLAELLAGQSSLADAVSVVDHVRVISAGTRTEETARYLAGPRLRSLLDHLRAESDHVIVSCPAVVESFEATAMAAIAGNCTLTVRTGTTRRQELDYAMELLAGVGVSEVNVVLDELPEADLRRATLTPAPAA